MVVIGGSATAWGTVQQDLVAIFGGVTVGKEVKGDTVAIIGSIRPETNAVVQGDTVAVLGNIKLAPNAKVLGDVVAVGGAVERALAAAFSIIMLFPGFLWIAWDRDKQSWHDKIAETMVVRLPQSVPLVCV